MFRDIQRWHDICQDMRSWFVLNLPENTAFYPLFPLGGLKNRWRAALWPLCYRVWPCGNRI